MSAWGTDRLLGLRPGWNGSPASRSRSVIYCGTISGAVSASTACTGRFHKQGGLLMSAIKNGDNGGHRPNRTSLQEGK